MPEEADFQEAMDAAVRRILSSDVSTAFPGTIVAPLPAQDGLVNVQPNHKYKVASGEGEITPAAIQNVVLCQPHRTKQTIVRPPKEGLIGSKVLVITCEHSLTEWRSGDGASVYPSDNRQFDFNDAVAITGLYPETVSWPNPQKPATFEILGLEGTKFAIGTQTADFIGIVYQVLFLLSAGVNPVDGQFLNLAQITPLLIKLLTISNPQLV